MSTTTKPVGHATFTNTVSGEVYKMSFFLNQGDTVESKKRELRKTVSIIKGWKMSEVN